MLMYMLNNLLDVVLSFVALVFAAYVRQYMKAASQHNTTTRLRVAVYDVVLELLQTHVGRLKTAHDGKLPEYDANMLHDLAVKKVKELFNDDNLSEQLVGTLIESTLADIKRGAK